MPSRPRKNRVVRSDHPGTTTFMVVFLAASLALPLDAGQSICGSRCLWEFVTVRGMEPSHARIAAVALSIDGEA
jgi:hypothetical protein